VPEEAPRAILQLEETWLAPRPKHPDKDLEALIRSLEEQGWTVTKGKRYYKARCSCGDAHSKTIHVTPQENYNNKIRTRLRNHTCWKEEK
jgi:hypothetical protein